MSSSRVTVMSFAFLVLLLLGGCATLTATATSKDASADASKLHDKAEIREFVRRSIGNQQKAFRQCYYDAIDELPGSEGKLVLSWEVLPSGESTQVAVSHADEKIKHAAPCVIGVIEKTRFPSEKGRVGVVVDEYPFYFSENGKTRFD